MTELSKVDFFIIVMIILAIGIIIGRMGGSR